MQQEFIAAGRAAYEAGYDGIELHGCHRYLICQFLNRRVNRREDVYAGNRSGLYWRFWKESEGDAAGFYRGNPSGCL